ncbi:DUF2232 domain-containing protein [Paenibacillus sp. NPDC058071]|uniref:DUF2232 domain-containing protein n=1 Tax=Paenibacillus sp. NPDC058071 TaxID=3346326 RepID=UPI0036DBEABC
MKGLNPGLKSVLWSVAALLLILTLAVPGLNLLTIMVMMVPYVVLYTMLTTRSFLFHLIPVWVIAALLLGPAVLIIALFFLVPAVVMGQLYRKKAPAPSVLKRTFAALLALLLLEMIVFQYALGISMVDELTNTVRTMMSEIQAQNVLPEQWTESHTDALIRTMIHSIPLAFMVISFLFTVVAHYISRRVLRAGGIDVPAMPEAKDWRLPRGLVMLYLIVYVMALFVSAESNSFFSVAIVNLLPLLRLAFAVQAIGFFFYIAHERRWNKVVPVLIAIPVLLIPPLHLIGVLDAAFPIRKSFKKN